MLQSLLIVFLLTSELILITNGLCGGLKLSLPVLDKALQTALLTSNITIGIFAANFSFLGYQFAPYKSALRTIPKKQLFLASSVLILAVIPLVLSMFFRDYLAEMLALNIPLLCYLSIQLILVTVREASPENIIRHSKNFNGLRQFVDALNSAGNFHELKAPELEQNREEKSPPPLHEFDVKLVKQIPPNNPLSRLSTVLRIAVDTKDVETFENVVCACVDLLSETYSERISKKEKVSVRSEVRSMIVREMSLMAKEVSNSKNTVLLDRYISKMILFFLSAKESLISDTRIQIMASLTALVCGSMQWSDRRQAILLATTIRQELTRFYDSVEASQDPIQKYRPLPYIRMIKQIGESAAENRASNLHYRCLEALGWLGCTVARKDDLVAGKQIMLSLVQIGRRSKKEGLDCHWDKCALLPIDHAMERLEWIFACVLGLDEQPQKAWTRSLSDAFSRMKGHDCVARVVTTGETRRINLTEDPKKKYTITYSSSMTNQLDFSDFSMTKEFDLM